MIPVVIPFMFYGMMLFKEVVASLVVNLFRSKLLRKLHLPRAAALLESFHQCMAFGIKELVVFGTRVLGREKLPFLLSEPLQPLIIERLDFLAL